jgi:4-hydroxybenzoate polyprenyltransferase
LRAFLELLRPANVVTALADVLAGFAIADLGNWPALPWLLLSTACLYGGGVVLNDFFDRSIDAIERPERPIPSGRVRPQTAAAFGAILLAAGVVAASRATSTAAVVAGLIAAAVVLYDAAAKRHAVFGPIVMGTCRGLNLVLGISAVAIAAAARWNLALLPFFYIWAITAVSRGEVHGRNRLATTFALAAVAGVIVALAWRAFSKGQEVSLLALALSAVLAWRVLGALWRAHRAPGPALVRVAVRTGVLSLVLLDAALAAIYAGTWYALLVLATALVAGGLAKAFAVT